MSIFLFPYSLMAGIHRVFDMALDKRSMLIVDLLPEPHWVRPKLVEGIVDPGEGGRLGAQRGYAGFLTRGFIRPRAYI